MGLAIKYNVKIGIINFAQALINYVNSNWNWFIRVAIIILIDYKYI